jgi:signal transduction histidine kinase
MVLVIDMVDYLSGYEITLRFVYCLPLILAVLARGRGYALGMAVLCDLCWQMGDLAAGARYSGVSVPVWNLLIALGDYALVIWLFDAMLTLHLEMEQRVRERTQALSDEMSERLRLEREIMAITQNERSAMGQELHDGICQHFTGTAMVAQLIVRLLDQEGHQTAPKARRLVEMIEDGIGQTRRLARDLLLLTVEEGLVPALEELARVSRERLQIDCQFEQAGVPDVRDAAVTRHLFRIAQEAVRNAVRHGGARRINIRLEGVPQRITMRVADNGKGFATTVAPEGGLGLRVMAHRAEMIGADFSVTGGPGSGTIVTCQWPGPMASR